MSSSVKTNTLYFNPLNPSNVLVSNPVRQKKLKWTKVDLLPQLKALGYNDEGLDAYVERQADGKFRYLVAWYENNEYKKQKTYYSVSDDGINWGLFLENTGTFDPWESNKEWNPKYDLPNMNAWIRCVCPDSKTKPYEWKIGYTTDANMSYKDADVWGATFNMRHPTSGIFLHPFEYIGLYHIWNNKTNKCYLYFICHGIYRKIIGRVGNTGYAEPEQSYWWINIYSTTDGINLKFEAKSESIPYEKWCSLKCCYNVNTDKLWFFFDENGKENVDKKWYTVDIDGTVTALDKTTVVNSKLTETYNYYNFDYHDINFDDKYDKYRKVYKHIYVNPNKNNEYIFSESSDWLTWSEPLKVIDDNILGILASTDYYWNLNYEQVLLTDLDLGVFINPFTGLVHYYNLKQHIAEFYHVTNMDIYNTIYQKYYNVPWCELYSMINSNDRIILNFFCPSNICYYEDVSSTDFSDCIDGKIYVLSEE